MGLATAYSRAEAGLQAPRVAVEVHLRGGLPGMSMVGLPEVAVRESKDRVRSALVNSQFDFPSQRITVNLAPADLPKEGGRFDLAVAVGLLRASGQLPVSNHTGTEFFGELSLGGDIRPVAGLLPALMEAARAGEEVVVPVANAREAALVPGLKAYSADHLLEVCRALRREGELTRVRYTAPRPAAVSAPGLEQVKGQDRAKRVLEIVAAGGHSLLMQGPPGSGKSLLASCLPGILPALTRHEMLQVAAVSSLRGGLVAGHDAIARPFRAPHHSCSAAALVGGGRVPRPGEISLAHRGVLFLDELPEFDRRALESLREPLETGEIRLARAATSQVFPADFQLVAAMNPCPCGYSGDKNGRCRCSADQVRRYMGRISGPLLDRIDMHLTIQPVDTSVLLDDRHRSESGAAVARRVANAHTLQLERAGVLNARLDMVQIRRWCQPRGKARSLLERAMDKWGLSARSVHRCLRVARTLADLQGMGEIGEEQVAEALAGRLPGY